MNNTFTSSATSPSSTGIPSSMETSGPPAAKPGIIPWFGTSGELPYWLDFFGVPLPPAEAHSERAFSAAWRAAVLAQERYRALDKPDQLYLTDGIMKRYIAVLTANNLSEDNPMSRELLLHNEQTSEQYHQQYKQSVDADPRLVAILAKLGLR